jgi:hypothetical protein
VPLADLARVLPDEPRWVETRWMLLEDRATVTGLTGDRRHFVASCTQRALLAIVGRPDHAFISGSAARAPRHAEALAAVEHGDHAAAALPGWKRTLAHIFRWPDARPVPGAPDARDARLLTPAEVGGLGHVPRPLRGELVAAAEYSPVAGAFTGGAPVAFCYASGITESLWDVSVDTLEAFRRRGLATLAFRCLAALMGQRGKWPVWGALDWNVPSLALAAKLGFRPSGRLAYFDR